MKTFRIIETSVFEVEAEDADEAEAIFLNSENQDEFFQFVDEREVEEA